MRLHTAQYRVVLSILVVAALASSTSLGQTRIPQPPPPQPPMAQRSLSAPGSQPAVSTMLPLDAKVLEVLDKARQAYASAKSYQDLGSITTIITMQGRTQELSSPAATTFDRPGKFVTSHEAMNLYSDGQTLWLYTAGRGKYFQMPLEQALGTSGPAGAQTMLRNLPALSMLLQPETSLLATREAYESQYRGQEKIGDRTMHHITLTAPATAWFGPAAGQPATPGRVLIDAYFDATTFMLLRLNLNMTQAMKNYYTNIQESPTRTGELGQVAWQFNAGHIRLNVPIAAETFVFKVPAEAEQVDSFAALTSNVGGNRPVNDEEEAERAEIEQARLPYPAPDFTLPDLAGQNVKLSDLRGKVVLLDFWATWCGPCRAALPGIQRLNDDLGGKGLQVLAVDIGEDSQTVLEFVEKNKMTLRVLLDEQDKVNQLYKVSAIPKTFLIDQQGKVVRIFTGLTAESAMREAAENLLKAATATQSAGTQPTDTQPTARSATRPAVTQPASVSTAAVTTQPAQ